MYLTEHLSFKLIDLQKKSTQDRISECLESSPCEYVKHQLTVRSNGTSTHCQYFHDTIYNFEKYNFSVSETFANKENFSISNLKVKDIIHCSKCKYLLNCSTGCRARALALTGDILKPDPVGCYLAVKREKEIIPLLPSEIQDCYKYFLNQNGEEPYYTKSDLDKILETRGYY